MRGFAIRFDIGNGADTDLVMISAPVFFAQTPGLFLELLQSPRGQGQAQGLLRGSSRSTRQNAWLTSHPVPASYAGVNYWVCTPSPSPTPRVNALIKYKAIPEAGESGSTHDEATAKGAIFYAAEMKDRLAKGPANFELVPLTAGRRPDQDPTLRWDDEDGRDTTPLGTIRSMPSRLTPPATPSASCRPMWPTASPGRPTTRSSRYGGRLVKCR